MGVQEDIRSAGTLGFVGSILALLPYVNIIGDILVLMALYKLSRAYGNRAIWRNALYALLSAFIGGLLLIPVIVGVRYIGSLIHMGLSMSSSFGVLGPIIAITIALYVIIVISGFFMRRTYDELGVSSGIANFNKAAKWYWFGALLVIAIVGGVLFIVADIYAILGYNELRR